MLSIFERWYPTAFVSPRTVVIDSLERIQRPLDTLGILVCLKKTLGLLKDQYPNVQVEKVTESPSI